MATTMVLVSTYLSLNAVDRSSWIKKVELAVDVEDKDVTTFASAGWKAVTGGLKSGTIAIEFLNDVQTGQLDETMWALLGTTTAFEVRPTSAVVGVSNPKFTGTVLVKSWTPVSGSPGDVNGLSVTYPTSGAVTRATA